MPTSVVGHIQQVYTHDLKNYTKIKKNPTHYKVTFHYCNIKDNKESKVTYKADANYFRFHC